MSTTDQFWFEVTADVDSERDERLLTQARVASASVWSFLAEASTPQEFDDRISLAEERLHKAVSAVVGNDPGAHAEVYPRLIEAFQSDFDLLVESRREEKVALSRRERLRRTKDPVTRARRLAGMRRTAGVYCKTHDVWVGDGNADTHEGCSKEQRKTDKTKESRQRRQAAYEVKKFSGGGSRWGIWDTDDDTWYQGDEPDAYYAAGVPYWKSQDEAQDAASRLSTTGSRRRTTGTSMGAFRRGDWKQRLDRKVEAAVERLAAPNDWEKTLDEKINQINGILVNQYQVGPFSDAALGGVALYYEQEYGFGWPEDQGFGSSDRWHVIHGADPGEFAQAVLEKIDDVRWHEDLMAQHAGRKQSYFRKQAYFTYDLSDVEAGFNDALNGHERLPGESNEWLVGWDTAVEGGSLDLAKELATGYYDMEEEMYGRFMNASRKQAVSLSNVGIDSDTGNGVGTTPDGERVQFTLSDEDRESLKAILYSDLAVNFSGVSVTEDDIIRQGRRRKQAGTVGQWEEVTDQFGTSHYLPLTPEAADGWGGYGIDIFPMNAGGWAAQIDGPSSVWTLSDPDTGGQVQGDDLEQVKQRAQEVAAETLGRITGSKEALRPFGRDADGSREAAFGDAWEDVGNGDFALTHGPLIAEVTAEGWANIYEADQTHMQPMVSTQYDSVEEAKEAAEATMADLVGPGHQTSMPMVSKRAAAEGYETTPAYKLEPGDVVRMPGPKDVEVLETRSIGYDVYIKFDSKNSQGKFFAPTVRHDVTYQRKTGSQTRQAADMGDPLPSELKVGDVFDSRNGTVKVVCPYGQCSHGEDRPDSVHVTSLRYSTHFFVPLIEGYPISETGNKFVGSSIPRSGSNAARRKQAMPSPEELGVEVGDIFYTSWGYNQTNVDFFEVVRLTGASVEVKPLRQQWVGESEQTVPVPGSYYDHPFDSALKRLKNGYKGRPAITLDRGARGTAWLWDGEPVYATRYGGH